MERTVKIVAFSAPDVEMAGHVTVWLACVCVPQAT